MQKNGSASELEGRLDSLKENVRNLVDAGSERAAQLKNRAVGVKDSVVENGEAALDRIGALIKAHPFAAIGIAFSVGYVTIRMLRK
jgi:ElaB/YqjD/DUF883 family membrane-anchored ribosome-binding protein